MYKLYTGKRIEPFDQCLQVFVKERRQTGRTLQSFIYEGRDRTELINVFKSKTSETAETSLLKLDTRVAVRRVNTVLP